MLVPKAFLLQARGLNIASQLRLEEAFLRTSDLNLCLINISPPPAVVLGISSSLDDVLFKERIIEDKIPVIRRFSGGGTVILHQEVIMISWIANSPFKALVEPQELMKYLKEIYRKAFPPGFDIRDNDYVIFNRKIGGNAQYIQKNRWVHHSSFLWEAKADIMNRYLKIPSKQPAYRGDRNHEDFVTELRKFYDDKETFIKSLTAHINNRIPLTKTSMKKLAPLLDRPHRKSTSVIDWKNPLH